MSVLRELVEAGATQPSPDGRTPADQLGLIRERVRTLISEHSAAFAELPGVDGEGWQRRVVVAHHLDEH